MPEYGKEGVVLVIEFYGHAVDRSAGNEERSVCHAHVGKDECGADEAREKADAGVRDGDDEGGEGAGFVAPVE